MYEWLEDEIGAVKTRKFFLTHEVGKFGVTTPATIDLFPLSFTAFVRKFGKSSFFRDSSTGCYAIRVLSNPRRQLIDDELFWNVGGYDEHCVLLKDEGRGPDVEWAVHEQSKFGDVRRVADTFEEWLLMTWKTAKAEYSPRTWKRILQGPAPFTPEELAILEARRQFRWKVVGIDQDCTLHLEVFNGSNRRLAYIGLGVHGTRRGVWLGLAFRVDHIQPGTIGRVRHDGLHCLGLKPDEIELFDEEEEPGPEDRELCWEFRPLPN